MNSKYMNLAELNQQLGVCFVDADKLASMGFFPVVLTKEELSALDEATRRKWRSAKLYPISKLQDIRASIGASMRDSCCELRLAGRELLNAAAELPPSHSIAIKISRGRTEVSTVRGIVLTPIGVGNQPLHTVVRYAIQCALAEAATLKRSATAEALKQ
jgi:hypothetical protein